MICRKCRKGRGMQIVKALGDAKRYYTRQYKSELFSTQNTSFWKARGAFSCHVC